MAQKFALRTLILLFAWLFLENFNFQTHKTPQTQSEKPVLPLVGSKGNYKIKKVVLDAGHGGKDPGCMGALSKEKNNTLAIVLQLGALITAGYPDVKVIYTRDDDRFIPLNERANIANRNNADLFISVHCNALTSAHAHGTETYVMGLHTAKHNLEVAKRENASIYMEDNYQKTYEGYDPNSPEAHIIGSVWQSAYLEQSILFAGFVQKYAHALAQRDNKGVKQAGFLVLRETAMPSVLVETGYLTNKEEEQYIASETGQIQMAEAIFSAFRDYKAQMEGDAEPLAQTPPVKHKPVQTLPAAKPVAQKTEAPAETVPAPKPVASKTQPVLPQQAPPAQREGQIKLIKPITPAPMAAYRIRIMTWTSRMDRNSGKLALLNNVSEEKVGAAYHYFVGNFATRDEAEKMLPELRGLGFKNAVVEAKSK